MPGVPSEYAPDSEVDGAILAGWVEARKFSTTRLRPGYDVEEVDAFANAIRDTFLPVRRVFRGARHRAGRVNIQVPGLGVAASNRGLRSSVGRGVAVVGE